MSTGSRYFFDVPVYRLGEEKYYAEMNHHIEDVLFPPTSRGSETQRERDREKPEENAGIRGALARSYGGCWRYNEIIGYIRLHFLGTQIRGEWYSVKRKRIVRTRTKTLEYRHWKLAPEIEVPDDATSSEIFELVLDYVVACRKELKGRYIDSEMLEFLGPHIDWQGVYAPAQPVNAPQVFAAALPPQTGW